MATLHGIMRQPGIGTGNGREWNGREWNGMEWINWGWDGRGKIGRVY
jgi:hypothetical protein